MKEAQPLKQPSILKHQQKQAQKKTSALQCFQQGKISQVLQSSIAQEQFFFSQLKRKDNSNKKNTRLLSPCSNLNQPSQNFMAKLNSQIDCSNSQLILGQSISKKTSIITINQLRKYEDKAKSKSQRFNFSSHFDLNLKSQEANFPKNYKSLKKSLSTSKLTKEPHQNFQEMQISGKNKDSRQQRELKQNRNSLDLKSIKSSSLKSLSKQSSLKKLILQHNTQNLHPMTVPFFFQNINTTINNLQTLEIQSSSSKYEIQESGHKERTNQQNINPKRKKSFENMLFKQLSSSQYFIDVPLDLNDLNYQLDMEVKLEKNRGFQVYLISPQRKEEGIIFEKVRHFKYQMVKLPPNMLRLRVYLLIQTEKQNFIKKEPKSSSKLENPMMPSVNKPSKREWKVWKQVQVPIMCQQKFDNDLNKRIKVSITNLDLNCISININNFVEFNLNLCHEQLPVAYYCLNQDFNGVQIVKLSLSGKEKTKTTQELFGEGCQGKCQLI